jgi:hypothetical protein
MAVRRTEREAPRTKAPALPVALAKRAKAAHEARRARLAAEGFATIALIREMRRHITGDYLAIGGALTTLRKPGMAEALGCADFAAICQTHFEMSEAHAERLIRLAAGFARAVALDLGYDRANALLGLADATPEDDAPEDLLHATLTLPGGERLVVDRASTEQIQAAAKALRQAQADAGRAGPDKGGRTTTVAERKAFRALAGAVAADARFAEVKLTHVARGKTRGAVIRAEVPQALWATFARAMAKLR